MTGGGKEAARAGHAGCTEGAVCGCAGTWVSAEPGYLRKSHRVQLSLEWAVLVYGEWTTDNRQQLYRLLMPFGLGLCGLELVEAELTR